MCEPPSCTPHCYGPVRTRNHVLLHDNLLSPFAEKEQDSRSRLWKSCQGTRVPISSHESPFIFMGTLLVDKSHGAHLGDERKLGRVGRLVVVREQGALVVSF